MAILLNLMPASELTITMIDLMTDTLITDKIKEITDLIVIIIGGHKRNTIMSENMGKIGATMIAITMENMIFLEEEIEEI